MRKSILVPLALFGMACSTALAAAEPGQLDFSGKPITDNLPLGHAPGNPTSTMPRGQRLISAFGERPVFSPDGTKLAFIGQSYGDAFEYDMRTRRLRNLTAHMPHRGFLRVHYLNDGSFLLVGPHEKGATMEETRQTKIELFWMDRDATQAALPLGTVLFEGIATSRLSNRIAWTQMEPAGATMGDAKDTVLKTAVVVVDNGGARLANVEQVATFGDCLTEAQDFLPGDTGLTMPCYHMSKAFTGGTQTEVLSVDFATKAVTRYPTPPQLYGEIEGIFPGGKRSLVECSGDRSAGMDLCVLDLNAKAPRYTRITHIMDYGRWKYGNPVVSPDGHTIAAQVGSADVADVGMGLGIVLIDVPKEF